MKIKVTLTLDIDPEAWTENYGVESAEEIREDVQSYAHNVITEQLRDVGVLDDRA